MNQNTTTLSFSLINKTETLIKVLSQICVFFIRNYITKKTSSYSEFHLTEAQYGLCNCKQQAFLSVDTQMVKHHKTDAYQGRIGTTLRKYKQKIILMGS